MSYADPKALIRESMKMIAPPPHINVADFAEKYRKLSSKNSDLPGKFRLRYTPYLREILECLSDDTIRFLVMMKSSQVAWTDGIVNNYLAYRIKVDPCPIGVLFPTDAMAKKYSKNKFDAMVEDNKWLQSVIAPSRSRDSMNTIQSKHFKGGHLQLLGSNSPTNLAGEPLKVIIVEEPDRCALDAGGEGDSLEIFFHRSKSFQDRKIILGGSPTIAGESPIEREFLTSDQRYYHTPCPECKDLILLDFSMVKWEKSKTANHDIYGKHLPGTAKIECPHCGFMYDNDLKIKSLRDGQWIAKNQFDNRAGFFLNELLSPFPNATLSDMVANFLKADRALKRGDHRLMITFENQSLGKTWQIKGEKVESDTLYQLRRHQYGPELDETAWIITAGVDVQKNRLELEIVAWSQEMESWQLDYKVLDGDPSKKGVWDDLDGELLRIWQHPYGSNLRIVSACIDEGGHHTVEVRKFCKERVNRKIFSVRGQGGPGLPFIHRITDRNPQNCRVHTLGVDSIKSTVMTRLKINDFGQGYCHFPMERNEQYFDQLTSEVEVPKYVNGYRKSVFQKLMSGARNEPLDCRTYATAALEILNPRWDLIGKNLEAKPSEEIASEDDHDEREDSFVPNRGAPARGRRRHRSNVGKFRRPRHVN